MEIISLKSNTRNPLTKQKEFYTNKMNVSFHWFLYKYDILSLYILATL